MDDQLIMKIANSNLNDDLQQSISKYFQEKARKLQLENEKQERIIEQEKQNDIREKEERELIERNESEAICCFLILIIFLGTVGLIWLTSE